MATVCEELLEDETEEDGDEVEDGCEDDNEAVRVLVALREDVVELDALEIAVDSGILFAKASPISKVPVMVTFWYAQPGMAVSAGIVTGSLQKHAFRSGFERSKANFVLRSNKSNVGRAIRFPV